MELNTIDKNRINFINVVGDKTKGGAYTQYVIGSNDKSEQVILDIEFQNAKRGEDGANVGVTNEDLLEIVKHRLECFQQGTFLSLENEKALVNIVDALSWLKERNKRAM